MLICSNCGQSLPDGTAFCSNCGNTIPQYPPPTPYPQQNAGQMPFQPQGIYPNPQYPSQPVPSNGKATASLVLGILSLLFLCLLFAGNALYMCAAFLPGIIGLILGVLARKEAKRLGRTSSAATAGIVCSIIGIAIALLMLLFIIIVAIILVATDSMDVLDNYL